MSICRSYVRSGIIAVLMALVAGGAIIRAYVSNGHTWGVRQVPYYVNPANNDVSQANAIAAIQAGAATWGTQSNADFSFYYMGVTNGTTLANNGKNEMFFRNDANGSVIATTYWWYDGSGHLVDADILFYDGGWKFYTGTSGCVDGVYIEDVAAHEFGHALGLGHSTVATATMYPSITRCATDFRTLDADDIAGVEALYPTTGSTKNTAPSVVITAPASNSSFDTSTAVTFTGSASDPEDGTLSAGISWRSSLDGTLGTGSSLSVALSAGTHTITATVTDSLGASASTSESIVITQPATTGGTAPAPPPTGITLFASGFKIKGNQNVDLSWSGATSVMVDVYRNGVLVTRTNNDGAYRDAINKKGGGSYRYKLCEAGTTTCSGEATVSF